MVLGRCAPIVARDQHGQIGTTVVGVLQVASLRERERERETDRDDRQKDRERERQTDRQADRQTGIERYRGRERDRETDQHGQIGTTVVGVLQVASFAPVCACVRERETKRKK